jgi:ATP-dependent Lon protease
MDKAVYGMEPAKAQIMQIVAQWIANPSSVGNVIALKGPMGVGKTSFARHGVAEVLRRPFEFFSLGGASDSANFVGHSYTYEGATWGRIADAIMSARCMNPVIYFDELDKVSTTAHGEEIISMLIHLTDRSQNSHFHDRYFAGVDFDLSQCLFVFSFNDETKIHPILKDRMQVVNCSGYTAADKKAILSQYVWPQILDRLNMKEDLKITEEMVEGIKNYRPIGYTPPWSELELHAGGKHQTMDPRTIKKETEKCHQMLLSKKGRSTPYVMTMFGRKDWDCETPNQELEERVKREGVIVYEPNYKE